MRPTRTGGLAAIAAASLAVAVPDARAKPIEVTFEPPEIEASDVCVARAPKHVLADRWKDWDGTALPDRPVSLVRRDMRLLAQTGVRRWADTIRTTNDLLLKEVESYDETDRMLDRIDLLVALGDIDTLREEGLAQELVEIAPSGSTSAKLTAARLLQEGTGVPKDAGRAQALLREAAYAGHPDAILQLAAETSDGTKVDGWDIDPNVAVTLAFGGMLGNVDTRICDRINQIAQEYQSGDIVAKDADLAEDWYRLSARLGGSNAAWDVAQMHLSAADIEREPDVLVEHLEQAAEAGLTYAELELGRIYAHGALVERDLDKAEAFYRKAADLGDETGLTRLVNLKRDNFDGSPQEADEIISLLEEMTRLEEPPAWAFSRLGNMLLEFEGRWAGEARAAKLFKRALELDPYQVPARSQLARIEMRHAETEQDVADVTSRLRRVVSANGRAGPMQDLQAAYRCRAPSAPRPAKHDYWTDMERFSGDKTVSLSAPELRDQADDPDPMVVAQLQTQALNGRATSLANLLDIRGPEAAEDRLRPLRRVVRREDGKTNSARGRAAKKLGDRKSAVRWLREAVDADEDGARMKLARLLRGDGVESEAEREEILSLVRPLAEAGRGAAIRTIVDLDDSVDAEAAWRTYRDAIERDGDFAALVFALPRLDGADRVDDYMGRIRAVMNCYSENALKLARAMHDLGRDEAVPHWIDVAEASAETGWEYVATADALVELEHEPGTDARAAGLYREGVDRGYALAMRRLLNLGKEDRIELGRDETVELYARMINASPPRNIPSVLDMVDFAPDDVKRRVEARIDRRTLFREAAAQGNPVAQLELAKLVQEDAETASDLERYAGLLKASAEQGNSDAMLRLSKAYGYGLGVERSGERSDEWLRRAAKAGNEEAVRTARMLETAKEPTQ